MSRSLLGGNVIFDYDQTLVPEESLREVLNLSLLRRRNGEARIAALQARSRRFMAGAARPEDPLILLGALLSIRREAIDDYVAGALDRITPFAPLFRSLRQRGARLFIVSAAFHDWLSPIGAAYGFPTEAIAANRLRWIGRQVVGVADWALLTSVDKTALVRRWRREAALSGPTVMVGDGAGDLAIHTRGLAQGFVSASYYCHGATAEGDLARRARAIENLEPMIVDLLARISDGAHRP